MRTKVAIAATIAIMLSILPFTKVTYKNEVVAKGEITIVVQGKSLPLSTHAFIEDGTTLVPVREIAEALGAKVDYENDKNGVRTVRLERGNRSAIITIGSSTMTANGKLVQLGANARTVDSVTMVPLRALSESLGAVVAWDGVKRVVTIDEPMELPTVNSVKKLRELFEAATNSLTSKTDVLAFETTAEGGAAAPTLTGSSEAAIQTDAGSDYSTTNVQVGGVDEADWAKTDGRFIYQLSGSRVHITDISNPKSPKLAATLEYDNKDGFYPQELYVDDKQLIVIGQHSIQIPYTTELQEGKDTPHEQSNTGSPAARPESEPISDASVGSRDSTTDIAVDSIGKMAIWPPINSRSAVKTFIYELSDEGQPKLVRETEQEGSYISSRKIGSSLYIVTNKYSYISPLYTKRHVDSEIKEEGDDTSEDLVKSFEPLYSDTAASDELQYLPLDQIHYFPETTDSSMMLVGALDLEMPEQPIQVTAYLGSGQTIYASQKHLYVAISKYSPKGDSYEMETQFHKFRLDQGSVVYVGEGSVPGTILNQFSMDEHNGFFRVAVTKGDMWATGEAGSTNNVYVLDEKLDTIGKLVGLAPGERIYSARFLGNRAYMVTFRNVDPLFAIDLRDPFKPAVLGQLKIPGYSDYLHPYDENHIIGFGKETIELPSKGMSPDETLAFYQGMKLALFDVSDVNNPKEKFKEVIGDRGTNSELLYNHKALLFNKEKGLLAFPVDLHEVKNKEMIDANNFPAYGEFTYQGAYVYRINLQEGFKLQGRISHLTQEDLLKSGQYGYDYTKTVKRILYAGNTLYTLSDAMLKANDMNSLGDLGSLAYPAQPDNNKYYPGKPEIMPLQIQIDSQ